MPKLVIDGRRSPNLEKTRHVCKNYEGNLLVI